MTRKLISLLVTLSLALGMFASIPAAAEGGAPSDTPEEVEAIEAIDRDMTEAAKRVLATREEEIKNNVVEVTSGSDNGFVLEDGKTYVFKKSVSFTNKTPGGSAITVPEGAKIVMRIEKGVTVTATGADGQGTTGAGAGVRLPESATLIITGEGALKATGGNAATGLNGANGEKAYFKKSARNGRGAIYAGDGGQGGSGGGGAGAGIGGMGGTGGKGGAGGTYDGKDGNYLYFDGIYDITEIKATPESPYNNETSGNLFDKDTNTKYFTRSSDGKVTVSFKTKKSVTVTRYGLFNANDTERFPERLPKSWVVYGSRDNKNWTLIDTESAPSMGTTNFEAYSFYIDNPGDYQYYKFEFAVETTFQLSEIMLSYHPASPTESDAPDAAQDGNNGEDGAPGELGERCGMLYVLDTVKVTAAAGKPAQNGSSGKSGGAANDNGSGFEADYCAGGGGGGGAGTGGKEPEYGIGQGGVGGAGGGGGGAGSSQWKNGIDNSAYAKGGDGGAAPGGKGEEGRKYGALPKEFAIMLGIDKIIGTQGGNGGNGAVPVLDNEISGRIMMNNGASIEGRLDGDIEKGTYYIDDTGKIVYDGILITDLAGFAPEDGKTYRFDRNITYSAPKGENGISIPEGAKVILEVPNGIAVNVTGGAANGGSGAGAGIFVPESATLVLRGSGVLNVTGGNASNGGSAIGGAGAGAGIGGKGGAGATGSKAAQRGTNCGTVYIMGTLKLDAKSGKAGADKEDYYGGRVSDFGIGGGGAGGHKKGQSIQLSGKNGDIYIDYASVNATGREAFYHRADLSLNNHGDVLARGYTDMILGNEYSNNTNEGLLYKALREVANHNALRSGDASWIVEDMPSGEGNETNQSCGGSYRHGYDWNKNFVDYSGGYVYLLSTYLGRYVKSTLVSDDYPQSIVSRAWDKVKKYAENNNLYLNDDMKMLLSELIYSHPFCEPFDSNREKGITVDNPTIDTYSSKGAALQQVDWVYTTVYDATTARYLTVKYNVERVHDGSWITTYDHYYYRVMNPTFASIDGYKGVTMKNWMSFIPDNASVGILNMPGTHDTGTYNIELNWEMVDVLLDNLDNIAYDNLPDWLVPILAFASPIGAAWLSSFIVSTPMLLAMPKDIPGLIDEFINGLAECNDMTIEEQLNAGMRTFDLRMVYNSGKKINELTDKNAASFLKLCHGSLEEMGFDKYSSTQDVSMCDGHNPDGSVLTLDDILNGCRSFLDANPTESVFLTYKCEGSDNKNVNKATKKAIDGGTGYSKALEKVLKSGRVVIIKEGDQIPTVKEAAGKIYMIERSQISIYEDHYSVNATDKINYLKQCFTESQSNKLRQNYDKTYTLKKSGSPGVVNPQDYFPRMIYSSTYKLDIKLENLINYPMLGRVVYGTPREIALGGKTPVNLYLDTYGYQRGQYYGWLYMNFPTEMATSNYVFSNIFDMDKINVARAEAEMTGSIFTEANPIVVFGGLTVIVVGAIVTPIILKKRKKKKSKAAAE